MPRKPLNSISSNIVHRKELNASERGIIIGRKIEGATMTKIRQSFNVPESTIRNIVNNASHQPNRESTPRSGRPKATKSRDERTPLRLVRIDPKLTYRDLIKKSGVQYSQLTVYRILRESGITNWLMKKRPLLRLKDVRARYHWAKIYKDWTKEEWPKVI